MSKDSEKAKPAERKIATSILELPELPEKYVRAVHITHSSQIENLLENGLNYEKYGMVMSMARAWEKASEVQTWSDDPHFNYPEAKALVMDMPSEEWRVHNNLTRSDMPKAPGIIPAKWIVGFVDAKKPESSS